MKVITNNFYWNYFRQDKVNLIRSLYVKSQSIASISNTTFWSALQTQTEWVISEPARTHHLGLKAQNFENPLFIFGCFSLKAVYNSLQVTKTFASCKVFVYVLFYSHEHSLSFQAPTYWNLHLDKRLLPDEVFQWW